ncbi:MAG: hypothetical protein BROFUL_01226 [Candidatus Brocadia fulgida]|uniref:Uncharacterized protein n=1 Tax=Candidatus Brocadia fulgida TaxID=380242 RepID=A0A0M2UWV0_9BACT|nr:MAG: hypothetical protein BROFUL_01226 [Candidatus Brocadia fulgida]
MVKLHEKHQSPAMQEEATQAVSLYYEMLQAVPHLPVNPSGAAGCPGIGVLANSCVIICAHFELQSIKRDSINRYLHPFWCLHSKDMKTVLYNLTGGIYQ